MERTKGSQSEIGMIYQYAITAYIAGQLSANELVKDYIIYSSAKSAGKFDDIVAKIRLKNSDEWFLTLMQVKHKDNKKLNITDVLKGKRIEYDLSEYISSFNKIMIDPELPCRQDIPNDNIRFCIFCNQNIQTPVFLRGECTFQVNIPQQPAKCDLLTKTLLPFGDKCWKFQCQDLVHSEYQRFFDGCHLYLEQENYVKINRRIQGICGIDNANDIVNYVKDYFNNKFLFKQGLHKQVFEIELQKIRLSKIILPLPKLVNLVDDGRVGIWNEITLDHDITIVDKRNDVDIEGCLFACLAQGLNELLGTSINWNETITKHEELDRDVINKFIEHSKTKPLRYWISPPITLKSLVMELWKLGGLPLILKADIKLNRFERYLHPERSYVVIGETEEQVDGIFSSQLKIFSHVGDIKNLKLRNGILENTVVSLQGRKETTLKNIVLDDIELMATFSSADIIGLMKQRIAYLKEDCLIGSNHLAFIIEDRKSSGTVDLTEPFMIGDNTTIECKPERVEELVRTIKGNNSYKNYMVYFLRRTGRHLELIEGDRDKLSNYFIDQFGDPVYVCGRDIPIPVIGRVIPINEMNHVGRYLRRLTLSSDYINLKSKAVVLLSGDMKNMTSSIEFSKIRNRSNAEKEIVEEKRYFIKVDADEREEYWNKFPNCAVLDVYVRDGKMELVRYKNCNNLIAGVSFDGRRFSEEKFFDEIGKNSLTVVTGEAGMGKSSVLTSLCNSYCENCYIVLYNLVYFKQLLRKNPSLLAKPVENIFKEFHGEKVNKYNSFLCALRQKKRIILVLDAFDEIIPNSEKVVLELMRSVIDTGIQVIVASRLKDCGLLMDNFNLLAVKLDPLSTCDNGEYLSIWKLEANTVVNFLPEFTRNPLYLNFLQLISESGESLADLTRFELYKRVINMKIDRRLQTTMIIPYESVDVFVTLFEQLALVVMFGKGKIEKALRWKYNTNSLDCIKFGIVTHHEGDYPVFYHFTFVEFLVAQWLVKAMHIDVYRDIAKDIYKQIVDEEKAYILDILSEDIDIHKAILHQDISRIQETCETARDSFKDVDKLGRTALHLASICCRRMNSAFFDILHIIINFMYKSGLNIYERDAIIEWDWTDYVNHQVFVKLGSIYRSILTLDAYLHREVWKTENFKSDPAAFPISVYNFKLLFEYALDYTSLEMIRNLLFLQNCKKREFYDFYKACKSLTLDTRIPHELEIDVDAGLTALHIACIYDSEPVVRHLIQFASNVDVRDEFGYTPLLYNVMRYVLPIEGINENAEARLQASVKNKAVIEMLLEKGANVNIASSRLFSAPLHIALDIENEELVRWLIEKGADVNFRNRDFSPLHFAKGEQAYQILLEKGADIKARCGSGLTYLQRAAIAKNEKIIRLLLEKGADINAQDQNGVAVLHMAHEIGEKMTRILLERGANVNILDKDGSSPLHFAVATKEKEVVLLLLEKGANINLKNKISWTPLHIAASRRETEIVRTLLQKNVDINSQMRNGYTPLHLALTNKCDKNITLLLEKGADVNIKEKYGYTPLHTAADREKEIMRMLLEKDADINSQTNNGSTALHIAVSKKCEDIVQLLLRKGADVNIKNRNGCTSLDWALTRKEERIVRLLMKKPFV